MCSRRIAAWLCLAVIGESAWFGSAFAEPIVYQEQAVASGSLGGLDFTDALVTISLSADTSTVISAPGGVVFNMGVAQVSIGSIGQATITDPLEVFVYPSAPSSEVGITDPAFAADLLDTGVPANFAYDLLGSLAPVSGASLINAFFPFATSAGDLDLVSAGDSTFSASRQDVPEPASCLLFCTAAGLLFGRKAISARRPRPRAR